MKYIVTINSKNYEVEVEQGQATIVGTSVSANAGIQAVSAPAPMQAAPVASAAPAPQAPAAPSSLTGELVKSPMPGTILAVKVAPGTAVKKGDILFILEAMKMENEICAPRDCVVAQIAVAKGASVTTGDTLASLQ